MALVLLGLILVWLGFRVADTFGGIVVPAALTGFGAGMAVSVLTGAAMRWVGVA